MFYKQVKSRIVLDVTVTQFHVFGVGLVVSGHLQRDDSRRMEARGHGDHPSRLLASRVIEGPSEVQGLVV